MTAWASGETWALLTKALTEANRTLDIREHIRRLDGADPAPGDRWQTSAWAWWTDAEVKTRGLSRRLRAVADAFRASRLARERRTWHYVAGERPLWWSLVTTEAHPDPFCSVPVGPHSDPCAIAAEIIAFERGDG